MSTSRSPARGSSHADRRALAVKQASIETLREREREFLIDMLASTDVAGTDEADLETLRDAYKANYDDIWLDDDTSADNDRHSADDYHQGYQFGARMVLEHLHRVFGIEPPEGGAMRYALSVWYDDDPNPRPFVVGSTRYDSVEDATRAGEEATRGSVEHGYAVVDLGDVTDDPFVSLTIAGRQIAAVADSLRGGEKGGDEVEHPAHDLDDALDLVDGVIAALGNWSDD